MPPSSHPEAKKPVQMAGDFLQSSPKRPLIVVIGPTASGKTAFSIQFAQDLHRTFGRTVEIINADSRQFYEFMDIGTAKITDKEMLGVSHHLLSVLDPREPCSIAWFQEKAESLIDQIIARANIPMMVGGSMLYVSSIVDGLMPLPSNPELRKRLSDEYDIDQGVTLHRRLVEIDPVSASSIPRENKVYLLRALEIYEQTGKPKSAQKNARKSSYDLLMFGMDVPREELNDRIDRRTKEMMASGWIDEVQRLLDRGYTKEDPGMRSIGYREIAEYLGCEGSEGIQVNQRNQGNQRVLDELSAIIAKKTRAYAKRHMTWWRRDPRVVWIRQQPQ